MTPIIQMVMLTAAALILCSAKVKAADMGMPIFQVRDGRDDHTLGIAWMADTFIASNEDDGHSQSATWPASGRS